MAHVLSRSKAETIALFAIYDVLTYVALDEFVDVESIISGLCSVKISEDFVEYNNISYQDCDFFVKEMTIAAIKHYAEIVPIYNAHMVKWTFDRLNRLEQALLILAYCHFFYHNEKTDKAIVINVAVNAAKKYLDANDYRFVNGILDKVLVHE